MTENKRDDLGKMLKQRRLMIPLTLQKLASAAGVSASHLGRIERGERFPSAWILRKIVKPLGLGEDELFASAGFLSPKPSGEAEKAGWGRLDPLCGGRAITGAGGGTACCHGHPRHPEESCQGEWL